MSEIVIREARPEDYDKLLRLIRQILTESGAQKASYFDAETWRWQCLTPGFETLIVIAEDDKVLAGCFHLVSKPMNVFGQSGRVALLQELAVAPEYRRKGIFTRMSRFASDQMSIRGWDVTYSMPNLRSYPGFIKNQGYQHLAWVPIRVRPLDTGQLLADRFPPAKLWQLAGDVIGSLFDTLFPLAGPKENYTIESINQFDSEVDALSRDFLEHTGIGLQRNARFLELAFLRETNWRLHCLGTSPRRAASRLSCNMPRATIWIRYTLAHGFRLSRRRWKSVKGTRRRAYGCRARR